MFSPADRARLHALTRERDDALARVRSGAAEIRDAARSPQCLGLIREHPVAAAGIAAGTAFLVARFLPLGAIAGAATRIFRTPLLRFFEGILTDVLVVAEPPAGVDVPASQEPSLPRS